MSTAVLVIIVPSKKQPKHPLIGERMNLFIPPNNWKRRKRKRKRRKRRRKKRKYKKAGRREGEEKEEEKGGV